MVTIVPYQATWPTEFQQIADTLRRALGDLAVRIDHIGSTSVPGLAAKDVIDLQITVQELDHSIDEPMSSIGYLSRPSISRDHRPPRADGPESDWEKHYFTPPPGQRPTHVHVRAVGRANQRYPLLFRDYLRHQPATAEAYAELKRRLAANLADSDTYPDVKDPAVDLIYFAAEAWAASTNWQPGPNDA